MGYRLGHTPESGNRYTFGGLSDAGFAMIPLLEAGADPASRRVWCPPGRPASP